MPNVDITRDKEKLDELGRYLYSQFVEVEKKRVTKELEWIESLRRLKGIYPPDILSKIPEDCSKVFIKYTKAKERYVRAKINSIVFPERGKSWSIKPTPVPEIPDDLMNEVIVELEKKRLVKAQEIVQEAGVLPPEGVLDPTQEQIDNIVKRISKKRCKKLERRLEDQLKEARYERIMKEVIKSGIRYGTGIWKGPLSSKHKTTRLINVPGEGLKRETEYFYSPYIKFVPIWNFYPDMSTADFDAITFIFELHCLTKKDLIDLSKQKGFFKDVILEYLREHPTGDYRPKHWEVQLMAIDENAKVNPDDKPTIRAYEVLEYWGYLDGTFLKAAGYNDENIDDNDVYEVRAWLLGGRIIKIAKNPLPYSFHPYNVFYYEKDETSIFGSGLPVDVEATQEVINASARMMLDNAAIVAGPQMEVNLDLLVKDQDITTVYPRKIWYRQGVGLEAQYPAIRSINLDSHLDEYMKILDVFKRFGDEESSIPSVLWTSLNTNETARGVLVRYKTAHITLMDIVKQLDEAIERFLRALVKWNYKFAKDPEIVGDFKIEAKGTDTLLEIESKLESLVAFMQTISEKDEPYLDRRQFLIERIKLFGLDDEVVVRTEEEAEEFIAKQQKAIMEAQAMQTEMIKAKTEYERAKAANMLAKSKKILTEQDLAKKQFVKGLLDDAEQKANNTTGITE